MKTGLREIVMVGVGIGALAVSGCSGLLGKSSGYTPSDVKITYPSYRDIMSARVDELSKSNDPYALKDAIMLCLDMGDLERADKLAPTLLRLNTTHGREMISRLQEYRNQHAEKK